MKLWIVIFIICLFQHVSFNLLAQSRLSSQIKLNYKDQSIELFEMNFNNSSTLREFYNLPVDLRLSINNEDQPEFLFMSYRKEGSNEDEAIMHWLLKMGLDESQSLLIDSLLKIQVDSNSRFIGQLPAESIGKINFMNEGGNSELLEVIKSGLISEGSVPVLPNTKCAAAFKYSGTAAQMMINCIHNPLKLKGLYIVIKYQIKSLISFNKTDKEPHPKEINLYLRLDKLFEKAKTCKECIITSN